MIPILANRSRYVAVNKEPTWHYHTGTLDGQAPAAAGVPADLLDPVVTPGRLEFKNLTHGGLFTLQGNAGKAIVVEATDGSPTGNLVDKTGATLRALPTAVPFTIAPGEYIKVSSGSKAGFLMRLAGDDSL